MPCWDGNRFHPLKWPALQFHSSTTSIYASDSNRKKRKLFSLPILHPFPFLSTCPQSSYTSLPGMSSTYSHDSSNPPPFSFLPPLIVYPKNSTIPKTDPYKLFRSVSSPTRDPSTIDNSEDPLTGKHQLSSSLPSNQQLKDLNPHQNHDERWFHQNSLIVPSTFSSRLSDLSHFSQDTDSEEEEPFEFDQRRFQTSTASTSRNSSTFEPVHSRRGPGFLSSSSREGSYHSQDDVICPTWKPTSTKIKVDKESQEEEKRDEDDEGLTQTEGSSELVSSCSWIFFLEIFRLFKMIRRSQICDPRSCCLQSFVFLSHLIPRSSIIPCSPLDPHSPLFQPQIPTREDQQNLTFMSSLLKKLPKCWKMHGEKNFKGRN